MVDALLDTTYFEYSPAPIKTDVQASLEPLDTPQQHGWLHHSENGDLASWILVLETDSNWTVPGWVNKVYGARVKSHIWLLLQRSPLLCGRGHCPGATGHIL